MFATHFYHRNNIRRWCCKLIRNLNLRANGNISQFRCVFSASLYVRCKSVHLLFQFELKTYLQNAFIVEESSISNIVWLKGFSSQSLQCCKNSVLLNYLTSNYFHLLLSRQIFSLTRSSDICLQFDFCNLYL